jgi:hypothetical protein
MFSYVSFFFSRVGSKAFPPCVIVDPCLEILREFYFTLFMGLTFSDLGDNAS